MHLISEKIENAFFQSMLLESVMWPSPGLVNIYDNGIHQDMDINTFIRSCFSIRRYFRIAANFGFEYSNEPEILFSKLREIGIKAETQMLAVTKGVNTHKGTIFLGLLTCSAASSIYKKKGYFNSKEICNEVKEISKRPLLNDFTSSTSNTTGLKAYKYYGLLGVRGEAITGLSIVTKESLPALKSSFTKGESVRLGLAHTLLILIAKLEDTTILNRDFKYSRISTAQKLASNAIDAGGVFTIKGNQLIKQMGHEFLKLNISPGGAADLLTITMFLYLIEQSELRV